VALAAAGLTVSLPREARAIIGGGLGMAANSSKFLYAVCDPLGGTIYSCGRVAIRLDPEGSVRHVTSTIDYDLVGPQFRFNQALSGPLGPFAIGGSAPAATPGIGTQPLPIFTTLPDTPGAPLAGSTLTIVDDGLFVTVDYLLAEDVIVAAETNYFLLVFDFLVPIVIDGSRSTVTYSTTRVPDADFTETYFLCESGDPSIPLCGSTNPSVAITLNAHTVPEPSSAALVATGLGGAALLLRRRRRPSPA
jgi:hypothetical protein